MKYIVVIALVLLFGTVPARAQDFSLGSPAALENNGFLKFLLPRFSLKTRVRPVVVIDADSADASLNTGAGTQIMLGLGETFYLDLSNAAGARADKAQRFLDWLTSDIGRRTIEQFQIDGTAVFTAADLAKVADIAPVFQGDLARGETLSLANCGRCHVVDKRNLMKGIGSTPSFALLRSLKDWQERFETFYLRNPHPSIVQIEDVTEPFSPNSPPANFPVFLTVQQVEDILTYVGTIPPADLGAPLSEN